LAERIAWITYITVVISVIIHGISSTPLMNWYERRTKRRRKNVNLATRPEES
jgi:NhaP-type Na+/H+ or K+/H+ antiporter